MNDRQPSKVCVLLGEHAYWHRRPRAIRRRHPTRAQRQRHPRRGQPPGAVPDLPALDGYDDDTIRRHAEAVLDRLIATEGSPT